MSEVLIQATDITKIYDQDMLLKRGKNEYALRSVNLTINKGEFISVMGPSGSGKSTLVNCLSTLERVSKGHLKIFNKDILECNESTISEFRNKYLGFIFQNHNLISTLSIYDNIAVPLLLNEVSNDEIDKRIKEVTKQLDIDKILDKRPHLCSGGECQRAAIARAIIHKPKIIFCDEPTGNLDSRNSHAVLKILSEMNKQGTTIVLVTHDSLIASYSSKLYYLYDGMIIKYIDRNQLSQIDFYHQVLSLTSQDTDIEKILSDNHYEDFIPKIFENTMPVYMMLDNKEYSEEISYSNRPLIIYHNYMIYRNSYKQDMQIPLENLKKIKLDLNVTLAGAGFYSGNRYYVLVDFIYEDYILKFKAFNQDDMIDIFNRFNDICKDINDSRDIIGAYHQYPNNMERSKYFTRTQLDLFKKINK